ncbi:hypothetical protein ALC62_00254 [Cyphomyrmex costatus]|uniref:Uncharacterized protein n=1 Tax=Cyphomyrmex costatus TaxID=456900 RepID=A0A195D7G0_9HYME|nr:hypothetical protein ALC62_00254 [Cyphomyrmex costatus]
MIVDRLSQTCGTVIEELNPSPFARITRLALSTHAEIPRYRFHPVVVVGQRERKGDGELPSCHQTQTPAPVGQDRDETIPMVVAATEAGREKRSWFDRWNRSQFVMKGERNWTPWSRRVGAPSEYN